MNAQPRTNGTRTNGNGRDQSATYAAPPGATAGDEASVGVLLKQLAHEVPALLTNEIALAKSEARENMRETKEAVAAVASGGVVLLGGFIVLLMAAVYGLSTVMASWLAALIVGGVVALAGWAMVQAGKKKFHHDALRPDHTLSSLNKDKDAIRGRTQ